MRLMAGTAAIPAIGLPGPAEAAPITGVTVEQAVEVGMATLVDMPYRHIVRFGILKGGELTLWPSYYGVPVLRAQKICNRIVIDCWPTTRSKAIPRGTFMCHVDDDCADFVQNNFLERLLYANIYG